MTVKRTMGFRIAQARRELAVREHKDISKAMLAAAAGVDPSAITLYEGDKSNVSEAVLSRLADYLGVTPAWLRYGVGDGPAAPSSAPDYIGGRHFTDGEVERARVARDAEQASTTVPAKRPARKANGGRKRG